MSGNRTILIYRDELLAESETFILAQGESLIGFKPFYVGLRRRPGLRLPESRVHIISRPGLGGKLQRARFKLMGPDRSLQSTLGAHQPALLHAHFGPDGCNAISLARKLDSPLIVSLHGYDVTVADQLLPRLYTRRRHLLASRATKFICVSEFVRKKAIEKGFPAEKLVVHYTGIDTSFFQPDASVSRSPIVLFVGRLVAKKGCQYLIRAVARMQKTLPDVRLVVIGEGPLRQELENQAASNLIGFRFLGAQQPDVVRQWMNRAMAFSTPSIVADSGDAEGFGMVFVEAQAMGLPVVSFASGGIPEAVEHAGTGFLVCERDWKDLAAKLLLVLQNDGLWARLSQSGRDRARRLFNVRRQAALLEQIYESAIDQWHRGTAGGRTQPEYAEVSNQFQREVATRAPHFSQSEDSVALPRGT